MNRVSSLEPKFDQYELNRCRPVLPQRTQRLHREFELVVEHHDDRKAGLVGDREIQRLAGEQRQQVPGPHPEQRLRLSFGHVIIRRRQHGEPSLTADRQVMREAVGGGARFQIRADGAVRRHIVVQVEQLAGRAQFARAGPQEVLVGVAVAAGLDCRADVWVAGEIVAFGEVREWVELGRGVVRQVVVQRAEPSSRGDCLCHVGIALQVPFRVEVWRRAQQASAL